MRRVKVSVISRDGTVGEPFPIDEDYGIKINANGGFFFIPFDPIAISPTVGCTEFYRDNCRGFVVTFVEEQESGNLEANES